MKQSLRIAPSILSADFSRLGQEIRAIDNAGCDRIHIDVMDGHFVPNLTLGAPIIAALRDCSTKPFDVHLMVSAPDHLIGDFISAGSDMVTVHVEATPHVHRTLQVIRESGVRAGVSLNPQTPAVAVAALLDQIDLILVMTVNPGYAGQTFIKGVLPKIAELRAMIDTGGHDIDLVVDGGITPATARLAATAGADVLVAGTAVFAGGPEHYADNILALRV